MVTSTYTAHHQRVESGKDFAEVTRDFGRQLGKFDPTVLQSLPASPDEARSRIEAMAGTSGFMLFGTIDHGALLSIFKKRTRAIQYVVGNPLFALQMTQHNVAAGLYAPLRVLIYEGDQARTVVEYDLPSSVFGQFNDERVTAVARMLDKKLADLVAEAIK